MSNQPYNNDMLNLTIRELREYIGNDKELKTLKKNNIFYITLPIKELHE